MKIAIVYDSITNNTEQIAEAIKDILTNEDIIYIGKPKENIEADFYFVGSWTDKGSCSTSIKRFLSTLKHKKIAYFSTAGFGGSTAYFDTIFTRVSMFIDDSNEVVGHYFCQGKMPGTLRQKYVSLLHQNPEDKKLKVSLENFDQALSHPNSIDIENAKSWALSCI